MNDIVAIEIRHRHAGEDDWCPGCGMPLPDEVLNQLQSQNSTEAWLEAQRGAAEERQKSKERWGAK